MSEKHCINARNGKHKWVEPIGKNKRHADAGIRVCEYCNRVEQIAATEHAALAMDTALAATEQGGSDE